VTVGVKFSGVGGKILLKWILNKWVTKVCTGLIWLRIGTGERGNEHSGSIKRGEFFD
jgi:hypothetical protein